MSEESLPPILDELDIDLLDIQKKILCVLMPTESNRKQLVNDLANDGDFWGPLFCVMCYVCVAIWGESGALSWSLSLWCASAADCASPPTPCRLTLAALGGTRGRLVGAFGIFVVARALGGEVGHHQAHLAIRTNIHPSAPLRAPDLEATAHHLVTC